MLSTTLSHRSRLRHFKRVFSFSLSRNTEFGTCATKRLLQECVQRQLARAAQLWQSSDQMLNLLAQNPLDKCHFSYLYQCPQQPVENTRCIFTPDKVF